MPVVVFDNNIAVSALINPIGTSWQALAVWDQGACRAISSDDLLAELAMVLERPRIRALIRADPSIAARFLRGFAAVCVNPLPVDALPVRCRDEKDEILLTCALAGRADFIVSNDNDVLALAGDPALGALRIVTSAEFLAILHEQGYVPAGKTP